MKNDDEIMDISRLTRYSHVAVQFLDATWERSAVAPREGILDCVYLSGELETIMSADRSDVAQRFRLRSYEGGFLDFDRAARSTSQIGG
jgi:hypothetical protein